jgi:hypothetical protein
MGSSIDIDRSGDYFVFKVNEQYALRYNPKYTSSGAELVKYQPQPWYFSFLGKYKTNDEVLTNVSRQGDWFYVQETGYKAKGNLIAINTVTHQKIYKEEERNDDLNFFPQNLKTLGITNNPNDKINSSTLAKYEELSVPKESAIVLVGGLAVVYILWLIVLPFAIRREKSTS